MISTIVLTTAWWLTLIAAGAVFGVIIGYSNRSKVGTAEKDFKASVTDVEALFAKKPTAPSVAKPVAPVITPTAPVLSTPTVAK